MCSPIYVLPMMEGEQMVTVAISIFLWAVVFLSVCLVGYWTYLTVFAARGYEYPPVEHDPSAVQVRILTVDAERVVQASVNAIPESVTDRHVIAEEPMAIDGATVHVVPDAFECDAIRKGRAIEWARRTVPCEKEYVLYLDEDSHMTGFSGVPDADVVQFRERPRRTGSRLAYLAELFRMGAQLEQRAFPSLSVPLYAWGGGIAVKKSFEDRVTWNTPSLIEDTTFVWNAAATDEGVDFQVTRTTFATQAPPTIRALIGQRRRWFAGSRNNAHLLSPVYRLITTVRNLAWALSAIIPVLTLVSVIAPGTVLFETAFQEVSILIFVFLSIWSLLGLRYYHESRMVGLVLLVLLPIVSFLHSLGACVGLLSSPTDFDVTRKVTPGVEPPDTTPSNQHDQ